MKSTSYRLFSFSFVLLLALCSSCKKNSNPPPINEDLDLDGKKINDSSLINPGKYLLSAAIPNPTPVDKDKWVVITAHGFSATNFEWAEFNDWAKNKNNIYISRVLLGGHGRDYEDFKSASWEDWQAPIIDEYNKLREMGYTKISLIASSTGCPLILDMVSSGKIQTDVLKHMFLIDPIVVPSNKTLSLVKVIGPAVGYLESEFEPGENGYWYKYRPQQALKQLDMLTHKTRKNLEKGIRLPDNLTLKVYKSEHDDAADPVSAVLLKKGIRTSDGNGIKVKMLDTELHVFTRLRGRANITSEQTALQLQTFEEIYSEL